jgi:hypothetical protein
MFVANQISERCLNADRRDANPATYAAIDITGVTFTNVERSYVARSLR